MSPQGNVRSDKCYSGNCPLGNCWTPKCRKPLEITFLKFSVNFRPPLINLVRGSFLETLQTVDGKTATPV